MSTVTIISRRAFLCGGAALALAYPLAMPSVALAHQDGPGHGGYPDALMHYALDRLKELTRWLAGKKCFVGEVGLPQNLPHSRSKLTDEKRWAALGNHWYNYAENRDFWVTAHGVSERYYNFYDGGYYASIWLCPGGDREPSAPYPKVIARRGYQAALVKRHRGPYRGVSFPNVQKWIYRTHSSYKPGRYDTDYGYPTVNGYPRDPGINGGKNSYEYLYAEGVRLIRLGFRWERIQPRLGHALDKTELGRMKLSVRNAGRAGLRVVLDLHTSICTTTVATGRRTRGEQMATARCGSTLRAVPKSTFGLSGGAFRRSFGVTRRSSLMT